jgi:DNA replication protein DnaC
MRFRVGDKGLCDRCNRQRKEKQRVERLWRGLQERIGWELQELDPEHPDFARAAYEKAQLWDGFKYFDAHGKRCFPTEEEKERGDWEPDGVVSLYVYGPAGCGKTRMAVSICRRECANWHVIEFVAEREFMDGVSAMARPADREASVDLFERLAEADLLFFDDLGTANLTEPRFARLFELVDRRYSHKLLTVWTSNKSPAQIREWVKRYWLKQGADEEEAKTNAEKLGRRITGTESEPIAEIIECE